MNAARLWATSLVARTGTYNGVRHFKRYLAPVQKQITKRKREAGPQPLPRRNTFIEWNREAEIYAFNKRLNEEFDLNKLNQAFIFKSYAQEERLKQEDVGVSVIDAFVHNEDLCTKGRDLTSKAVNRYLTKAFPSVPEACIKAFHNYLLSDKVLADASQSIGTKDIILSEEQPPKEETLALTFLAIVGALIESTDEQHTANFVRDFLITILAEKDLLEIWCPSQPLSTLDNILQTQQKSSAEPRLVSHAGKNTILSSYQIAIYSSKEFLGSGFGHTIQEAKDIAATNALCRMFGLLDSSQPLRFNESIDLS